jgi:large subunit ribosomal protein L18
MLKKDQIRARRKRRIRGKISGSPERPRLSVFRSSKHIYAQAIDDSTGVTLATASTLTKEGDAAPKTDEAKTVGTAVAKALLDKGISQVVFDRNGFIYHGRVRALADAAREAGLKF